MNNFIDKHKVLVTVIAIIITVGVFTALSISSFRSNSDSTTTTPVGIDDPNLEHPLPIGNAVYTVDFAKKSDGSDDTSTVIISAGLGYRNAAINTLYDVGINPMDVTIKFQNYENPFNVYE